MRMSTSPSPGSGVGRSINSKLPRLGAPSGRLFSKIWRLMLAAIDTLLRFATTLMLAGRGEGALAFRSLQLSVARTLCQRTCLIPWNDNKVAYGASCQGRWNRQGDVSNDGGFCRVLRCGYGHGLAAALVSAAAPSHGVQAVYGPTRRACSPEPATGWAPQKFRTERPARIAHRASAPGNTEAHAS